LQHEIELKADLLWAVVRKKVLGETLGKTTRTESQCGKRNAETAKPTLGLESPRMPPVVEAFAFREQRCHAI
jgi:hypothetical protein